MCQYKTAAYSALLKSQQHVQDEDEDYVTNEVNGDVVLVVLRDTLLQKTVSSFLTMNDKLSLIFAVSDEDAIEGEDSSGEDKNSEEGDMYVQSMIILFSMFQLHDVSSYYLIACVCVCVCADPQPTKEACHCQKICFTENQKTWKFREICTCLNLFKLERLSRKCRI
jgi:hypothetical protein